MAGLRESIRTPPDPPALSSQNSSSSSILPPSRRATYHLLLLRHPESSPIYIQSRFQDITYLSPNLPIPSYKRICSLILISTWHADDIKDKKSYPSQVFPTDQSNVYQGTPPIHLRPRRGGWRLIWADLLMVKLVYSFHF